ncbi:MAG: hypothetical protein K5633_04690, partial [Paludibacteraceae bacterium]|nr:hypothetical protein [Paludibacteraceae bacterium]
MALKIPIKQGLKDFSEDKSYDETCQGAFEISAWVGNLVFLDEIDDDTRDRNQERDNQGEDASFVGFRHKSIKLRWLEKSADVEELAFRLLYLLEREGGI